MGLVGWQPVSCAKTIDSRMLQEPANNAFRANIFREPANTGLEAANPANDEIDRNARHAGLVESVNDVRVDERVEFHPDGGGAARLRVLDLGVNFLDDPRLDAIGRNIHLLQIVRAAVGRDVIEDF